VLATAFSESRSEFVLLSIIVNIELLVPFPGAMAPWFNSGAHELP